ncbi:MAG: ribosome-associated translation inhibitor RaiA [Bdellovibrionales bacterium]|nr:ribosome-associated translation inhibitor RaiA [Bdellovibrionales bacterium]
MNQAAQLQMQHVFKGMDSSEAVKDYSTKKAGKIVKHTHNHVVNCHFVFQVEKDEHVAQCHIVSGDLDARAESRAENMYAAIDEVTDKLVQQARKFNEKHHSHSGKPHHNNS